MQFIKMHFIGAVVSSMYFLLFFYLYVMCLEGHFDYLSLPFIFLFIFPIYLIIANPITVLIGIFLKKVFRYYIILLTFIVMIVSFLFNYGLALHGLPEFIISGNEYINLIIFSFFTAIPSVLGVEYSNQK